MSEALSEVKDQIDHDLEIRAMSSDDVDQQNTVQTSHWVIGDSDERRVLELIQDFLVVNVFFYFVRLVDKKVREFGSGLIAVGAVHPVAFVDDELVHHPPGQFRMFL